MFCTTQITLTDSHFRMVDEYPSLNIDSHPQQEEQGSKAHEDRGNSCDQQLLEELPGELAGGHLDNIFIMIIS